jgi:phenylalanyl-tRNA synthetase alpha subunit
MAEKNLASIAKKSGTSKKASTARKPAARKTTARKTTQEPAEKKLTAAQERDLKAKQKVEELLKDTELTAKKEDLLELDETPVDNKSTEWLQEQVGKQADLIEQLRNELATAKGDYKKLHEQYDTVKKGKGVVDDSDVKKNVIRVFNELQENYIKMGVSPSGRPNFQIVPVAFMNRLIMFFPFLKEHKRYK